MSQIKNCPVLHAVLLVGLTLFLVTCTSPWSTEMPPPPEEEAAPATIVFPLPDDALPEIGCETGESGWVTDLGLYPTPQLPEPAARVPFRDPLFHSCLVRVTDRYHDLPPDDPSGGLKNEYSRAQAFNADSSLLIARSTDARWYLYDAASLEQLGELPINVEPRWDARHPHRIYHFDETRLMLLDLEIGQNRTVHDFADDIPGQALSAVWTRYEGSPSFDGRYWGLMAQNEDWQPVALLVYDLELDRVISRRDLQGGYEIDAVTISPLGTYFLAYFDVVCQPGQLGDDRNPCGLMVYDRQLTTGRSVVPVIGHSDTAIDYQGREVVVFQDIQQDEISYVDLESGSITPLFPIDFSHSPIGLHFSGRARDLPGWILISTYSGAQPSATWMDDGVFALEIKPGGRVVRLAHTHSLVDENQDHDYWAEPQASVNQDFSRVVFTTNWGRSGTDQVEMFMILLPSFAGLDRPREIP